MDHVAEQAKLKKLSSDSLIYIAHDCREAIAANPDNPKCGDYADTMHYCSMELESRKKSYGRIK